MLIQAAFYFGKNTAFVINHLSSFATRTYLALHFCHITKDDEVKRRPETGQIKKPTYVVLKQHFYTIFVVYKKQ